MRVESLVLNLRPRSMFEAADLGLRLAGTHARSLWRCFAPVYGLVFLLALSTVDIAGWLPPLVIFCLKPWLDRTLLFVLSRAVFGQATTFADVWAERRAVWGAQWFNMLTVARLSAHRAYVLPVQQLEGQHGAALRQRLRRFRRSGRWAACAMQWAMSWVELSVIMGLSTLAFWFAPQGDGWHWLGIALSGDTVGSSLLSATCYGLAVFAVEPFFVGAGFAMYLNRRVQLEAWDIEQEFRLVFA